MHPGDETVETSTEETEAAEGQDATPAAAEAPSADATEPPEPEGDGEASDAEPEPVEPEIVEPPSPEERRIAALEEERDALQERLSETQGRLRAVSKAYQELQKDMEEFRKRQQTRAKIDAERRAADVVRAFFDPVQNLKRAIEAGGSEVEDVLQGVRMIHHQFHETMKRLGLEEVPGEGATFDPEIHEALAVTPVTEPDQDGKVLMVHRSGYRLGGHLIQAAQVVIGKHQDEAPAEA